MGLYKFIAGACSAPPESGIEVLRQCRVGTRIAQPHSRRSGCARCHGSAFDAVAGQRLSDESAGLHFLDKPAEEGNRLAAAIPGYSHRLPDDHEPAVEQTQSWNSFCVGFELLFHASSNIGVLLDTARSRLSPRSSAAW